MQISGKVVLITGAAGGIGKALVQEALANDANTVEACDRSADALAAVARLNPQRIRTHVLDVTNETAVTQLAEKCPQTEILINCHGVVVHESYLEAGTIDAFRSEMEINYWGQVLMCRAFAPIVSKSGGGAIANFLSPLAYITFPFTAAYCATKAACRVLTEAMRAELSPKGTLVMAVFPGAIDTQMMTNLDIPKSPPGVVAKAVMKGIVADEKEVWAGASAEDMRLRLRDDPEAFKAEAALWLRLKV